MRTEVRRPHARSSGGTGSPIKTLGGCLVGWRRTSRLNIAESAAGHSGAGVPTTAFAPVSEIA